MRNREKLSVGPVVSMRPSAHSRAKSAREWGPYGPLFHRYETQRFWICPKSRYRTKSIRARFIRDPKLPF